MPTAVGFVYEDGDARSIYHASWSVEHPEVGVVLAVDLGDFGEDASRSDRRRACLVVRATSTETQFGFIDAGSSSWSESNVVGRMLSRDEALTDPERSVFLAVAGFVVESDPEVAEAVALCAAG